MRALPFSKRSFHEPGSNSTLRPWAEHCTTEPPGPLPLHWRIVQTLTSVCNSPMVLRIMSKTCDHQLLLLKFIVASCHLVLCMPWLYLSFTVIILIVKTYMFYIPLFFLMESKYLHCFILSAMYCTFLFLHIPHNTFL